jgi:hypothetical protein
MQDAGVRMKRMATRLDDLEVWQDAHQSVLGRVKPVA